MSESESQNQGGPPKVPYFYLSHASADDDSSVHDFFTDLSYSIRFKAKLTSTEVVGRRNTSGKERDEALRTSRVMIALLSPAYLKDRAALLEWQIFEFRRRCALLASHLSNRETLKRSIIPICWSPFSGSMPMEIRQTPLFEGDLKSGPNVTSGVKSLTDDQRAAFVKSLAQYIIEVTSSFHLTPLEAIPEEIPHGFKDRKEPEMNSETTKPPRVRKFRNLYQPINQNLLVIDAAFVKGIPEQVKAVVPPTPVSNASFSTQTAQATKLATERYLVFTIDNKPEDMQQIDTTAGFSPDFDVKPYTDSDRLLADVTKLIDDRKEPDLIVLNPAVTLLTTHRHPLIDALLEKGVPSAILATAKNRDAVRSLKVRGINDLVATLPESFTSVELLELMRHWAKTGRDKRFRRGRSDERPVFLSYSSPDEAMASKICKWLELREIGVWYSPHTLKAGDPWIEKIIQGLHSAEVFIALISDHYPGSKYCDSEMAVALDRLRSKRSDLRIIPVLYNASTATLGNPQIKMSLDQHAATISDMDSVPGLSQILESVQVSLKRRQKQS